MKQIYAVIHTSQLILIYSIFRVEEVLVESGPKTGVLFGSIIANYALSVLVGLLTPACTTMVTFFSTISRVIGPFR